MIFLGGLFLFLLDRTLKYNAVMYPETKFVWKNIIGWEYFANPGIAFSLPFPNIILLFFTPIIIFALCAYYIHSYKKNNTLTNFSIILIIAGTTSNFIDRYVFGITIDYLRLFTSVINIADIMIILGLGLFLLKQNK